jgi:hypothetical protein
LKEEDTEMGDKEVEEEEEKAEEDKAEEAKDASKVRVPRAAYYPWCHVVTTSFDCELHCCGVGGGWTSGGFCG